MQDTLKMLALVVALATWTGCKQASHKDNNSGAAFPTRVAGGSGDATVANKVGVLGVGQRLVVDLQRPQQPGDASLWPCWAIPVDTFAFGRAVCVSDPRNIQEVTTANVDLTCGVNPDFGNYKASAPLSLDGCEAYDVFAYEFSPTLYLKVAE